jgi:hypothetical protein
VNIAAALRLIVSGKNPAVSRTYTINQETVFEAGDEDGDEEGRELSHKPYFKFQGGR